MLLVPSLPSELHLLAVFAIGVVLGSVVNWAVYSLRFDPRPTSPWSCAHPRDAEDLWLDRVPLFGWFRLRRKGKTLGYEFWIRPLVIELLCGAIAAGLYGWEVIELGLAFHLDDGMAEAGKLPAITSLATVHAQFVAHTILAMFMVAISFIDIDEQTVPDELTVPGTILGLIIVTAFPIARLPDVPLIFIDPAGVTVGDTAERWMNIASPWKFPTLLEGSPHIVGLAVAVSCLGLWCFGLLPRRWRGRHGWTRATKLIWARIAHERLSRIVAAIFVAGTLAIIAVCSQGGVAWESLTSALVALAVGGLLIWFIRIIGQMSLGRESMGFGDVTLMAMIGSYLGWQAAVATFIHAVFIAMVLGVVQWIVRRNNVIPFGPFICMGALATILRWRPLWMGVYEFFAVGWPIPALLAGCLVMLGVMLGALRLIRGY